TSGATFNVNTDGGGYGDNYQTVGSNKWLRVWSDDGNDPTIRISWTQMHFTSANGLDFLSWGDTGPQMTQNWVLMEFLLTENRLTAKIDGELIHDADASQLTIPSGLRINPYMIGFNGNSGKTQITQEINISDVYMDHSPTRFNLDNAGTLEAATKIELQRPIEWDDQEVKMKARFVNLDPLSETIYLIYSDDHAETAAVAIN